jgi:hypothetical protein
MRHHSHTPLRHLVGVAYGHASTLCNHNAHYSNGQHRHNHIPEIPTPRTVVLILQGPLTIGGRFLRAKTETAYQ